MNLTTYRFNTTIKTNRLDFDLILYLNADSRESARLMNDLVLLIITKNIMVDNNYCMKEETSFTTACAFHDNNSLHIAAGDKELSRKIINKYIRSESVLVEMFNLAPTSYSVQDIAVRLDAFIVLKRKGIIDILDEAIVMAFNDVSINNKVFIIPKVEDVLPHLMKLAKRDGLKIKLPSLVWNGENMVAVDKVEVKGRVTLDEDEEV